MRLQSFRSANAGKEETNSEIAAAGSDIMRRASVERDLCDALRPSSPGLTRASTSFFR